jgi:heme/copper-type cytochrome/quinol oxidase subunit 2
VVLLHINTEGLGTGIIIVNAIIIGATLGLLLAYRKRKADTNKSKSNSRLILSGIIISWIALILMIFMGCILSAYYFDSHPLLILAIYAAAYTFVYLIRRINS